MNLQEEKRAIRKTLHDDIYAQGEMVLSFFDDIEQQVRRAVGRCADAELGNIYLMGCGDSFYAAKAVRAAFLRYAGTEIHPVEAFEFNAYESEYIKGPGLAVGISVSGQVGTTLETIERAKKKGFRTLGVNGTPGSRIYSVADEVVDIRVRVKEPGPVPQTYHYLSNMNVLCLMALNIGLRRGHIDGRAYDAVVADIKYNLAAIRENAERLEAPVTALAHKIAGKQPYVMVGSGPNLFTAEYGVAKLHEAACMGSIWQGTEEWAHEQYFMTKPDVTTFVIAAPGAGVERAKAILQSLARIQCPAVCVTTRALADTVKADVVFSVDAADNEALSPMAMKTPFELFAYALGELYDVRPLDYDNPVRKAACEQTIYAGGVSAEEVGRRGQKG